MTVTEISSDSNSDPTRSKSAFSTLSIKIYGCGEMLPRLLLIAIVAACTHSCYARTQQNYYVTANSRPVTHGVSLAPGQDICQGNFPEPVCHDHFDPMDKFSWQSVEARMFRPLNPNPNPTPPRSRTPP